MNEFYNMMKLRQSGWRLITENKVDNLSNEEVSGIKELYYEHLKHQNGLAEVIRTAYLVGLAKAQERKKEHRNERTE